jgi:RNA-directed DNA polymerase
VISLEELGSAIADAFLAGEWEAEAMSARAAWIVGGRRAWQWIIAEDVLEAYRRPPLDRPRELARYVTFRLHHLPRRPRISRLRHLPVFHPATVRAPWPVPRIDTVGDLAERLELDAGQLAWLADVRGLERVAASERLRNYRYSRVPRANGPARVLERPKQRLKEIQRWIAREILLPIPVHDAAHGFVRGRSAGTHASAHTRRHVVLRFDLEDFFAAVSAARVYGIFRTAGYPEGVAHTLTGLCTNTVPPSESVSGEYRLARRLAAPHLPQGAPTSPALANLAAYRLDVRLFGLARALGASYTRYADDLVFSSASHLRAPRAMIAGIVASEGFRVNAGKTRIMGGGSRQLVTGIIVNERRNVPREDYERLKATLHNARRDGPGDLDPAHLLGRIAWVASLNPARGRKLRTTFATIDWSIA